MPEVTTHFSFITLTSLTLILTACGGGASTESTGKTATNPNQNYASVTSSNEIPIYGAAIKGPIANALVNLYSFDNTKVDLYDKSAPIATGFTNPSAAIEGISVASNRRGPFTIVVDATNAIDLNTGTFPAMNTLVHVFTKNAQNATQPVYITPLTTLAVSMANLHTSPAANSADFLTALSNSAKKLEIALDMKFRDEIDILNDPPIIATENPAHITESHVIAHRAAIEKAAAIVHELKATQPEKTTTQLTLALAQDIEADGIMDGTAAGIPINGLDKDILAKSDDELTIPNTSYPISQVDKLIAAEGSLMTVLSQYLVPTPLFSTTTQTMAVASKAVQPIVCASCEKPIKLSWDPSPSNVSGYMVYFKTKSNARYKMMRKLIINKGHIVASAPTYNFKPKSLRLIAGDTLCFRVKAFNDVGTSSLSKAICTPVG